MAYCRGRLRNQIVDWRAVFLAAAAAVMALSLEATVRVEGDTVCPTVEEVQAELLRLSNKERDPPAVAPAPKAGTDVATLRAVGDRLHVELHRPDGTLVGEKELDLGSRCGELARAVAVVVMAWESQIGFGEPPQVPAAPPRPAVQLPANVPPPVVQPAAAQTSATAGWGIELGLGASLVLPDPRPGAELLLATRKPGSSWLGQLVLDASTWRSAPLGGGTGRWMRASVGLGAGHAWRGARLTAQLEARLLGGVMRASAEGFGVGWAVRRQTTFEPGLEIGLRLLGPRLSRLGAWLAVESAFWPRRQAISATDQAGAVVHQIDLPRFELRLVAGGMIPGPL